MAKRTDAIVLTMAVIFMGLAIFVMGTMPWAFREHATSVKAPDGTVRQARPYTEVELRGRQVYIREGCWYCHSQYVRPVTGEDRRWGPVSQEGEYAYDVPHMFGTRRIGPDLSRIGGKYHDDWHLAHHFDPRMVVPDSIMPRFPWLYKGVDTSGKPIPTEEALALVAYIQKLGTNLGPWRKDFLYLSAGSSIPGMPLGIYNGLEEGKAIYERRCIGCHGVKGDGKGAAAIFLTTKPRVFTDGIFKLRSTPNGSLPTDADLYRTITMGIPGTAMPPWHELTEKERWYLVQYVKSFSDRFKDETPEPSIVIPPEPQNTPDSVARGKEVFKNMQCAECHGEAGKGDGPSAETLRDNWGNPIKPYDFTRGGQLKGGPAPRDLYRAFSTGLDGTPMPSFADSLTPDQRWDLVHFIMSLSEPGTYLRASKQP
jgi:cbb3-type cytochrome oxidase cytochrome c subunit/mono/diheme cytochrome c family protein